MEAFWAAYGFYLWGLTTALTIIALAWLGWTSFGQPSDLDEETETGETDAPETGSVLASQVQELAEGAPVMRASVGRALQFVGLERYVDSAGAPAFALAVVNARGDGFLLVSSVRGGLTAKPLTGWGANSKTPLSNEEQFAVSQARSQLEQST
jgi:hypothetical protein